MRRELDYYTIGDSWGGSQDWFTDMWMNRGGCGAVTACETCIYLARYRGLTGLYPFDPSAITKEDFLAFGEMMRPFLSPRHRGIDKTSIFMDGFRDYLATRPGSGLTMRSLEGAEDYAAAERAVRESIDAGLPVAYLMLRHTDPALDDYNWHWFILAGYDDGPEGFLVKTLTYSEFKWFDLRVMWDTGFEEKGGMVLYTLGGNESSSA